MAITISCPSFTSMISRREPRINIFFVFLALVMIIVIPLTAQAQYPQPTNSFVNDYAGILTNQDSSAIQSSLQNLKNRTGVEMVLVTIGSLRDYNTGDNSIESFATNLFNRWGVGDASRNNGVMVLFDRDERKVRVELGGAYSRSDDEVMRQIIDQTMLPYFRNNQYSQGLLQGVNAVMNSVAPRSGGSAYNTATQTAPTTSTTYGSTAEPQKKRGLSFGKIILIILVVFIIYRIYRSRARRNNTGGMGPFGGGSSKGRGSTGSFDETTSNNNGGFFGGGSSRNSGSGGNFFGGGSSNISSNRSPGSSGDSRKGSSGGGGSSGSW